MLQTGGLAGQSIRAWYVGGILGRTFIALPWKPRLGLQLDVASGDRQPGDGKLGTFNPLFPSGTYVTLAGYTGLSNLVHLRPSVTVEPVSNLTITAAAAAQ